MNGYQRFRYPNLDSLPMRIKVGMIWVTNQIACGESIDTGSQKLSWRANGLDSR